MRQILGYVLVKETNQGIPNLVVTGYDSGGALDGLRNRVPTAEVLSKLGKRISSVLTDPDGKFLLSTEDLEFPGNEPRPDLVVAVFAPEDIYDPKLPYPHPPEERILYMSVMARVDAGAQEAFIIRLLQSQLDGHQIGNAHRLASTIEESWQFRETVNTQVTARYAQERKKAEVARRTAKEKTKSLSAIPHALRKHELLVVGKAELAKKVDTLQQKSITDGLDRMAKTAARSTMRLYLKSSDLQELKLREVDGKLTGELTSQQLAKKVRSLIGGLDLVRSRGPSTPSPEELEAKYLRDAPPIQAPNSPALPPNPPATRRPKGPRK